MIDVCLLLEGTYPYVAGGVSSWVHQFVTSMTHIRFGIVYIAAHSDPTRRNKYDVPNNVLYMKEIYLHDYEIEKDRARSPKAKDYEILYNFYDRASRGDFGGFADLLSLLRGDTRCFDIQTLFTSKEVWRLLEIFYDRFASGISFLDFFWTWRGTHLPLFQILQAEIPPARVYHAISTGYAGLVGAVAKLVYGEQFFLTEHGIYTYERMLEISQANWIFEHEKKNFRADRDLSFFKQWWIAMFRVMSRLAYDQADRIFTLYEGNKIREVLEGADANKITVIPNGIDLPRFATVVREKKDRPQVGLIGRVVNIKDVKSFIQAAKLTIARIPDAQFYVVGPTDEEEDYFEECRMLVEALKMEGNITFTGRADVLDYYRFLDVVVLTSLSEAQPFVILEANVVGIPVVATDVGACREMIEGRGLQDRALGPSGIVTEVSNPEATAEAIAKLLTDHEMYRRMGAAGQERVKMSYDQDDLLSRYLNIYEQYI